MDIVIDTCAVKSICRSRPVGADTVTHNVRKRRVRIIIDQERALVDEWMKTCGEEIVKQLIIHWEQYSGMYQLEYRNKIPGHVKKELGNLGFSDTCDKLAVEIAQNTAERTIVSNDPDFWDPTKKNERGNSRAMVADYLHRALNIVVISLYTLARKFE